MHALPEEEAREPDLAAGPQDEIALGQVAAVEMLAQGVRLEHVEGALGSERANCRRPRPPAQGVDDLLASPVAHGDLDGEAGVARRVRLDAGQDSCAVPR